MDKKEEEKEMNNDGGVNQTLIIIMLAIALAVLYNYADSTTQYSTIVVPSPTTQVFAPLPPPVDWTVDDMSTDELEGLMVKRGIPLPPGYFVMSPDSQRQALLEILR